MLFCEMLCVCVVPLLVLLMVCLGVSFRVPAYVGLFVNVMMFVFIMIDVEFSEFVELSTLVFCRYGCPCVGMLLMVSVYVVEFRLVMFQVLSVPLSLPLIMRSTWSFCVVSCV